MLGLLNDGLARCYKKSVFYIYILQFIYRIYGWEQILPVVKANRRHIESFLSVSNLVLSLAAWVCIGLDFIQIGPSEQVTLNSAFAEKSETPLQTVIIIISLLFAPDSI